MGQHYGEDYERAISQAGQAPGFWASRRETILHYKSGGAVLDLGCSSGGFLAAMKGPTWKLYGIEMSERTAREAERNSGGQVFAGDILDAPFPSESFEVITCFHVLEHLHKPRQVLARAYDWLRPGGVFYVMVPNIRSAGARLFRSYWYALEIPRHLFHFSPDTLSALARSVGLQGMSITTHRHLFVEASVRYILDGLFAEVGIHRAPMAQGKPVSFLRKVLRKGFRVGVLPVLERLAAVVGEGESIFAVFAKN
jgi:SAM-dependent methyltransferase